MITSPEQVAIRRDRLYERYAETRPNAHSPSTLHELITGREPVFNRLFAPRLPRDKSAAILDVGCGYGAFLYSLEQAGYCNTEGIDLDPHHIEVARRLGIHNVRCGNATDLLRDCREQFDCIVAIDLLEHIPKAEVFDFLELVRQAMRPGGRFLCQVPNVAAFYTPLFFMDFTHETPFTAPSLKQVLHVADLVNVEILPIGPIGHGVKSSVRSVLWKLLSGGLRLVQTIEGGPRDPLDSIYTAAILGVGDKSKICTQSN